MEAWQSASYTCCSVRRHSFSGFRGNYMDFLSCTCKNTAQLCAAAAGSSLTRPLALAGSRLLETVYMLSFKNSNPKQIQEVPVEGRGVRFWGKQVCREVSLGWPSKTFQRRWGHGKWGDGCGKGQDNACINEFSFPSSISIITWLVISILLPICPPINQQLLDPHAQNSSLSNLCLSGLEIRHKR